MKLYATSIFFFALNTLVLAQDSTRFYQTIDTLSSNYFFGRGYTHQGHIKTAEYLKKTFSGADFLEDQNFNFEINHFYDFMFLKFNDITLSPCQDYIPLHQSKSGQGEFETYHLDSLFFISPKRIKKFLSQPIKKYAIVYHQKFEGHITDHPQLRKKIYQESSLIIKLTDGKTLKTFGKEAWMPPSFSVSSSCYKNQKRISFKLQQRKQYVVSKNIIATIKGTSDTTKEIIICAHYDHVGGYEECYIPGANDNASGVAMLIELYHYFKKHPPTQTIKFIAFAGEEVGLVGSKFFVDHSDLANISFVLNLDLLGAGSKGITVVNATIFKTQFNVLTTLNNKKHYVSKIKPRGEAANSDHYFFSKNNIPAFFIYSNGTVGGYHHISDKPQSLEHGYFNNLFFLLKDFISVI